MKALSRWLPALVVMGVIFFLSSRTPDQLPDFGVIDFFVDQAGHAIGYAALGASYLYALTSRNGTNKHSALALALALAYALTDEYHQSFVPMRSPNTLDIITDGLGAVIGLTLYSRYSSNSRSKSVS